MLSFLRPKVSVNNLAGVFARTALSLAVGSDASSRALVEKCISGGANPARVRFELGSFAAFIAWCAIVRALQTKKLSADQCGALEEAFWTNLKSGAAASGLDQDCLKHTGENFMSLVAFRMEVLTAVTTQVEARQVLSTIIDTVSECMCISKPDTSLKLILQSEYLLGESTLYDTVKNSRLVS